MFLIDFRAFLEKTVQWLQHFSFELKVFVKFNRYSVFENKTQNLLSISNSYIEMSEKVL